MAILFTIIFAIESVALFFWSDDARLEWPLAMAFLGGVATIWLADIILKIVTVHPNGYLLVLGLCMCFVIPTALNLEK